MYTYTLLSILLANQISSHCQSISSLKGVGGWIAELIYDLENNRKLIG